MEDTVDLAPDVFVGRLACMFGFEVRTMVNKIIDYETNTYGSEWFNTIIVGGGDTFDKSWEGGTDYNEGEEANEKALEYMTGFDPVRIYASLGNLQTATIHDEISDGAGFLCFLLLRSDGDRAAPARRTRGLVAAAGAGNHPAGRLEQAGG